MKSDVNDFETKSVETSKETPRLSFEKILSRIGQDMDAQCMDCTERISAFMRIVLTTDRKLDNGFGSLEQIERYQFRTDYDLITGARYTFNHSSVLDTNKPVIFDLSKITKIGSYTLDSKNRVVLPKQFAGQWKNSFVVTSGPEYSLLIVASEIWSRWKNCKKNDYSFVSDYLVLSSKEKKSYGRANRLAIPANLTRYSHIYCGDEIHLYDIWYPGIIVLISNSALNQGIKNGRFDLLVQKLLFDLNWLE